MGKLCGFALEDLGFLSGHFPLTPQGVSRQLSSCASLPSPNSLEMLWLSTDQFVGKGNTYFMWCKPG